MRGPWFEENFPFILSEEKPRKNEKIIEIFYQSIYWFFSVIEKFSIISASCSKLSILHSPKTVEFSGSSEINGDLIADVFAASLGYSVPAESNWDGLHMKNPFKPASAAVSVIVEGDEMELNVRTNFSRIFRNFHLAILNFRPKILTILMVKQTLTILL